MARPASLEHARRARYARIRRSKRLLAWLDERSGTLDGTVAAGVTITYTPPVAASGVLTLADNAIEDEVVTIGSITYTWRDTFTDAGYEVAIGADADESLDNLIAAIMNSGTVGTQYSYNTDRHPTVSAAAGTGDTMDVTAQASGTAGNAIATTTDMADGTWGEATLESGAAGVFAKATHGYAVGDGPFVITAGTTLPAGYTAGQLLWVKSIPTTGTFTLGTKPNVRHAFEPTDDGTGTLTFTRAVAADAILAFVKERGSRAVQAATDIDDL
jgi:hypothetical protein